jgi:hypothetical protein
MCRLEEALLPGNNHTALRSGRAKGNAAFRTLALQKENDPLRHTKETYQTPWRIWRVLRPETSKDLALIGTEAEKAMPLAARANTIEICIVGFFEGL